ncbi:hypothetical protein Hanom_Chr05g00442241 [Helianthus anomalus]
MYLMSFMYFILQYRSWYDLVFFWSWSVIAGLIWSCFGVLYHMQTNGCKPKGVKWSVYKLWV